jgi:hypothetical protein
MEKEKKEYCTFTIYGLTARDCTHMGMRLRTHFSKLAAIDPNPKPDPAYAKIEYPFSQAFALDTGPRQTDISEGINSLISHLRKKDGSVHAFHTSFVHAAQPGDTGHYHTEIFTDARAMRRLRAHPSPARR